MTPLLSVALMLAGIDHILLGVPDLKSGVRAFEQATGVTPVYGGKHPNRGTENALVSLGNGVYLELIAPQPQPDAETDLTRELAARRSRGRLRGRRADARRARDAVRYTAGVDDARPLRLLLQCGTREINVGPALSRPQ